MHKAILMWNQKMGRATGTTVYEFVHQWQRDSYARRAFPEAKLRAWPAMMFDYMNLLMIEDFHTGRLNSYDRVFIAVGRPTRTYRLDELGNFDYRYEDLDGTHEMKTEAHYAADWAVSARGIMDFLDKKRIEYTFIKHFDLFDYSRPVHNIQLRKEARYTSLFMDTYDEVMEKAIPKGLYEFGDELGFYHRNQESHFLFSNYLKNLLT